MKKIPTMFERDWNGDRSRVIDKPHPDCGWVFSGEGVATMKIDGTCCMFRDSRLFKRHEVKPGKTPPPGFELADHDDETGKSVGWLRVGEGPEDKWHREALSDLASQGIIPDGTYELLGPKIQGNPEALPVHKLIRHGQDRAGVFDKQPERTFEGIRAFLEYRDIEGIVFHHPDGRMAKIKKRDFGLKR